MIVVTLKQPRDIEFSRCLAKGITEKTGMIRELSGKIGAAYINSNTERERTCKSKKNCP